jgi:DHA2 family multidrug resistance protein
VSGLINFMRNIGSGVGTSMVTTIIARRAQYHQSVLLSNLNNGDPAFFNTINGLTNHLTASGFSAEDALSRALGAVYRSGLQQAMTLSYIDTFWVLGMAAAIMFGLSFTLRKNEPGQGEHHAEA